MNQGKRYILYTILAVCGVTVVVTAATRLYATAVEENTPQWKRRMMSLGLAVAVKNEPVPESSIRSALQGNERIVDLSPFRDLKSIAVEGEVAVEIISAPEYRLIMPAAGVTWSMATEQKGGGQLRIKADGTEGVTLRIEAPTISSIEAQSLRRLTIRGWQAVELTVRVRNLDDVHLEECIVGRWILHAETPVALKVDKATTSAGLNMRHYGQIRVDGAGGQTMNLRGTGGYVSIRIN
jgi:hypothetical protein